MGSKVSFRKKNMAHNETPTKGTAMFKTADPTRRTPTWLQAGTKENIIWQLKMTVLVVAAIEAKSRYDDYKLKKNAQSN